MDARFAVFLDEETLDASFINKDAFVSLLHDDQVAAFIGAFKTPQTIEAYRDLIQAQDKPLLLLDAPEYVQQLGLDGVLLSSEDDFEDVREKLNEDYLVGLCCQASRHRALVYGEKGASFLHFQSPEENTVDVSSEEDTEEPLTEILTWWSEVIELPSMAQVSTEEEAKACDEAGADFLLLSPALAQQLQKAS